MKSFISHRRSFTICALCFSVLMLGGGAVHAESDNFLSFGLAGGSVIAPNADLESSPSWQVLIGFEKMHTSQYLFAAFPSPFVQYRFLRITEGDFGAFKTDASLHLFEFGFRFYEGIGS